MRNVSKITKEECCGCSGCFAICPKNAITMQTDKEGFLYPSVDSKACIDCGLCVNVCEEKFNYKTATINAYAGKNKNDAVLKKSSSGGVSHALCAEIIRRKGVVYGVVYDNKYRVIVTRAEDAESCDAFYGSKYVQADPHDSFRMVKVDLKNGKDVLYFGTSCYIAGLLSYLTTAKVKLDNLYTVDLICHGVPSPKVFADYIKWLGDRMEKFEFRTKNKPWGYGSKNFGCTITTIDGKQHTDTLKSRVFLNIFFSNNCLRPHCHNCEFCGIQKPADITIADYWGCKDEEPEFFTEKGVSAILVHSEKGNQLLHAADELELKKTSIEKIEKKQGNLHHPSRKNPQKNVFWNDYFNNIDFSYIAKKYGNYKIKARLKRWVKNILLNRCSQKKQIMGKKLTLVIIAIHYEKKLGDMLI